MFPIANALQNRGIEAQRSQIVQDLQKQYGEQEIPEFQPAINMILNGDHPGGMRLLLSGINERNREQKDLLLNKRKGQAAEGAANILRPRPVPGIVGFDEARPDPADWLAKQKPSANWQDSERPPTSTEITDALSKMDPALKELVSQTIVPVLTEQYKKAVDLSRPKMSVHEGNIVTENQLRGTGKTTGMLQPTQAQQALEEERRATAGWRTAEAESLKKRTDLNQGPLGTKGNPHVTSETAADESGKRRRWKVYSWVEPSKDVPGRFERHTFPELVGEAPFRPYPPRLSGDQEMIEETEKDIPDKAITDTRTLRGLQANVPGVLTKLVADLKQRKIDWNAPGDMLTLPSGEKISKKDALEDEFLDAAKGKAGVTLTWNGSTWQIGRAWIPGSKELLRKRRFKGAPGTIGRLEPSNEPDD
jgi:hypothetical protein